MAVSKVTDLLEQLGTDVRQSDIADLQALLITEVPPEDYEDVAGNVWEAVALVVNHPDYTGDAKVPDREPGDQG